MTSAQANCHRALGYPVLLPETAFPDFECIRFPQGDLHLRLPDHQALAGGFHNSFGHLL